MNVKILLLPFYFLLFSCMDNKVEPVMQKPNTYLALGDSYTIGESVDEQDRWPVQFIHLMIKQGKSFQNPGIIAKTGWTTDELIKAIEAAKLTGKYDMVSLLIGVNNQYRGWSKDTYRKEVVQLLNTAIGFADGKKNHVVVVSIPDYGVTPFAADKDPERIAREIDEFNAINKEESIKAGVHYVDITAHSRLAKTDPALIANDKLHPSGKMYQYWAERVAEEMGREY
jgi:lysophospholipase L1-like esterase